VPARVEVLVAGRRWMLRPLLGRPAGPEAGSDGSRPCAGGGYEDRIQQEVSNMAAPDQRGTYWFRSAEAADAARAAELVDAAYGHYVERIGMLPGPMTDDYAEVICNRQVTVAEHHGAIVGIIVLTGTDEGFLRRHLRTDKVILVAESMGTLTAGSLVKRRPDRAVDLGPGTQTWPGRSEPPASAEPGPQAALPARGARSTAATRWIGWWVFESAGRTGRGFAAAVPRVERTV
jgi:pimeloyl-ACP methyl ester carboxylesterase